MSTVHRPFPVMGCLGAVGLLVIGAVAFGIMLYLAIGSLGEGLTQFAVPGNAELRLPEAGTYTIFHEHRSTFGGRTYSTAGQVSGLSIKVRNKMSQQELSVSRPMGSSNYTIGGRQGFAVFAFTVKTPGTYVISGEYPPGQAGTPAVFAVGKGIVGTMLIYMFGGFGIAGLCGLLALVIGVTSLVRYMSGSRKARNDLEPVG